MLCKWSWSLCQEYEKKGRSPELPFNPAIALLLCIVVLNRRRAGEGGGGTKGSGLKVVWETHGRQIMIVLCRVFFSCSCLEDKW